MSAKPTIKEDLIHAQATAWESVCTALNDVAPNWHFTTDSKKSTADCAVETIRHLAALAKVGPQS